LASDLPFQRVLLTNDDGIDAPGLAVLEEIAATLAREVWIVAPERDQSGTSHSISLHAPLRVSDHGPRRYGIAGTPGDCVIMAARHLMRETPPELILSGVNRGANLGVETVFSGTVGAAMTGLLLGVPSIALSQAFSDREAVRWNTARTLAPALLRHLLGAPWPPGICLNVNFPDVDPEQARPMQFTTQGVGLVQGIDVKPMVDPRAIPYYWLKFKRAPNKDAADSEAVVVLSGGVSVTPLRFERTDQAALQRLRGS
jgi:5'-nucleotidase